MSTEFATMDKGYTPNRKELNLKRQYRNVLSKNSNVKVSDNNSEIQVNTDDIMIENLDGAGSGYKNSR
jgi:hypothetical protein